MRIVHRISIMSTTEIRLELAKFGIVVGIGPVAFEVDEASESWERIRSWVYVRRAIDLVSTVFSHSEVLAAPALHLVADWHCGYPEPDVGHFGCRNVTYDLAEFCECCGVGVNQEREFVMRGEPSWGKRGILQMNWVFDQGFVKREVWRDVFAAAGVACRPVLSLRGGELSSVVQLVSAETVGVDTAGLQCEVCHLCGRAKYAAVGRGFSPALTSNLKSSMAVSDAWFASGGSAYRLVFISRELHRAIVASHVRGASVRPVGTV